MGLIGDSSGIGNMGGLGGLFASCTRGLFFDRAFVCYFAISCFERVLFLLRFLF